MDLRHCVIPAAGLGTRFLPATKALPKELLPVLDRPVLQWGVEEAVAAGADTMVVITSRGKEVLAEHFDAAPELERMLEARGKSAALTAVRNAQHLAKFVYVYQAEPLGLGHAVLCAEPAVGNNGFMCMLPDDLSHASPPVLAQLAAAHRELETTILALMRCTPEEITRYGCATIAESRGRLHRVTAVVEKPKPGEATSDLAIMGRYVFTPGIFDALRATRPGVGGEVQLTDGIGYLLGGDEVWGLEFEGELLDVGTPEGWMATNLRLGREDARFSQVLDQVLSVGAG